MFINLVNSMNILCDKFGIYSGCLEILKVEKITLVCKRSGNLVKKSGKTALICFKSRKLSPRKILEKLSTNKHYKSFY